MASSVGDNSWEGNDFVQSATQNQWTNGWFQYKYREKRI